MTRFFFYGTLMPSANTARSHVLSDFDAQPVGRASLTGYRMFSVGRAFPAIIPGDGVVHGEVVEVPDMYAPEAVMCCDGIEGYNPRQPERSMYQRICMMLDDGSTAWVYVWNQDMRGLRPIPSGDWLAHREERVA